jgi:hypothetical protein
MKSRQAAALGLMTTAALFSGASGAKLAWADDARPISPHIDEIREGLQKEDSEKPRPSSESYSEKLKRELKEKDAASENPPPAPGESYTEQKKRELNPATGQVPSYTEQEKAKLPPGGTGGAIQAYNEGRSTLRHGLKTGEIRHAGGFRVGATVGTPVISASTDVSGVNFTDIYPNYSAASPGLGFFYEYQPFHSEWVGSLGLYASLNFQYFKGNGTYAVKGISKPGGGTFDKPDVTTQFFVLPATIGLSYRFNLLRVVRPFVTAGPTLVGMYEVRSDGHGNHAADARAITFTGGASILLDWLSSEASWDLYKEAGVQHYYLTVEFDRVSSFGSDVSYNSSAVLAGLTFEF